MPGVFDSVLPVVTAFLGAAAALGGNWVTQSRQDQREATARQHERETAALKRREEFELAHLIEVNDLLRTCVDRLHALSAREFRWAHLRDTHALTDEAVQRVDEARVSLSMAQAAVSAQIGFILDDDVREAVRRAVTFISIKGVVLHPGGSLDANELAGELLSAYEPLSARVRAIYTKRAATA
ncbi:hypothetical protein ACH470_31500 [Streptomyces bottropensis]|uniref:hypothetical protein n=1 Tax=Streptomyces bottropensis TaxID=42235 RepID=UPI003791328F